MGMLVQKILCSNQALHAHCMPKCTTVLYVAKQLNVKLRWLQAASGCLPRTKVDPGYNLRGLKIELIAPFHSNMWSMTTQLANDLTNQNTENLGNEYLIPILLHACILLYPTAPVAREYS